MVNGCYALIKCIPGVQAKIRSVLLLKEGVKTRLAGVLVGLFALLGFLVFSHYITLITSAVFVGVLFKAGLDVIDRDFVNAYFKNNWSAVKNRNLQLIFIIYSTLVTILWDLNIAVVTGTIFFFLAKKYVNMVDAEEEFEVVQSDEISG